MPTIEEREIVKGMLELRRKTSQATFVEAFLAVMSVEGDGVRVRLKMTWPRPPKAAKPAKPARKTTRKEGRKEARA